MKSPRQLLCLLGLCLLSIGSTASASGRVTRIKADFGVLRTALVAFEIDTERAPTEAERLDALVNRPSTVSIERWKPALDEPLLDPWGNPYGYRTGQRPTPEPDTCRFRRYTNGDDRFRS